MSSRLIRTRGPLRSAVIVDLLKEQVRVALPAQRPGETLELDGIGQHAPELDRALARRVDACPTTELGTRPLHGLTCLRELLHLGLLVLELSLIHISEPTRLGMIS